MIRQLALLALLFAVPAAGQTELLPKVPSIDSYWEIGSGLNIGLLHAVVSKGRVWGELSTVIGVPVVTASNDQGAEVAAVLAVGYGLPIADDSRGRWVFDLFLESTVGRLQIFGQSGLSAGLGFGFGFRWLLFSGWSVGMRMPCFGMSFEQYNMFHVFSPGQAVSNFFELNIFSWSVLTIGYRF